MVCKNCNREIPDGSMNCPFCGTSVGQDFPSRSQLNALRGSRTGSSQTVIPLGQIIDIVIGAIAMIYALVTYSNDTSGYFPRYDYHAPLTTHELMVFVFGIGGAICLIIGLTSLSAFKNRKK